MSISKSKKALSCVSCKLQDGDLHNPKMQPYGKGKKDILIIGEAPGKAEDRSGMLWQGRTGRKFQRILSKYGINMYEDCICVNAVNCRPPGNRTPTKHEVNCCREVMVHPTLEKFQPHIILLLGATAVQSFLQTRWPVDLGGITKWRGWVIPDQHHNAWVVPTYHPAFVNRADSKEYDTVWEQDLAHLPELLERDVPEMPEPKIHYIEDLRILEQNKEEKMAFDYETTGLKSKQKGMRIVSASVSFNDREVYSFLMPKSKAELRPFLNLLTDPDIKKMAHNMKFENQWTLNRYGVQVENWYWDSMIAAHQLDNRTGVTGLKFQTYVNFGVVYGDEVLPYLRKNDDDPQGLNRIYDLLEEPGGKEKLLKYGAYDSYYEYRLALQQQILLDYELPF